MYHIYTDREQNRVDIRFDSVLNRGLEGFDESFRLACLLIHRVSGYFDLLVDYTQSDQMTGDVLKDAGDRVQWCLDNGLRKSANITTTLDLRTQINVIAQSQRIRTFETRDQAVEWLKLA